MNTLENTTAPARFGMMMDAGPYADRLRNAGLYVETKDIAAGLSGKEYDEATREYRFEVTARPFAVGDGATVCGWSDRHAYTVIARTAKTLTLQADDAKLLNGCNSGQPDALQFTPGGFVGHTSGRQRYEYTRNPSGHVVKAFLTNRGWQVQGSPVVAGRSEHYDFNF